MSIRSFQVIVIGGGHAGVEAAWAAANLAHAPDHEAPSVALVTLDPSKIGVMSCNPAIGGLAKGQIVREVDALGGLMGLATDATGIQFKVLNTSKGAAVHGPRAQCDKHAYAEVVQRLIASRPEIEIIAGSVEELLVEHGRIVGVRILSPSLRDRPGVDCGLPADSESSKRDQTHPPPLPQGGGLELRAPAVVLTTGTFMRGLMHTGEDQTPGGRFGESAAVGISGALRALGFELGRLKTGTPPRLSRRTIRWDELPEAGGDAEPVPFSDLSLAHPTLALRAPAFPVLQQVGCRLTATNAAIHDTIRANIHRAPMYSGQIESTGPRYCPSIEDKVVRFAERTSHQVFLEPESLRPDHDDWIYCNGISTSLPTDVQDAMVRGMPGCEYATILRYGYAVEYDMVKPHQISATGMTKLIRGLFLAGQINGTSGYEEAAAQGIVAGINAARFSRGMEPVTIGRDQAYIGVLMDDLVTKTPTEPYRMFTSRAEHRLMLRADNAPDRLTPMAQRLGLLDSTELGRARAELFDSRRRQLERIGQLIDKGRIGTSGAGGGGGTPLSQLIRRPAPEYTPDQLREDLRTLAPAERFDRAAILTAYTDRFYAAYIQRQQAEVRRHDELERRRIPPTIDYRALPNIRNEARQALARFRPETLGQAARLEGITPADVTLLSVLVKRENLQQRASGVSACD